MDLKKQRNSPLGTAIFAGGMLLMTILFAALGYWQMERKAWKEELIAASNLRANAAPIAAPAATTWAEMDVEAIDYQPVTLTGRFIDDGQVRVFISLPKKANRYSGPGYWIMTPFELADGGLVYVNRGFVPQEIAFTDEFAAAPTDEVTLTGILRRPERAGGATLEPDLAKNVDWVINPERFTDVLYPQLENVAPFYVVWQPENGVDLPQAALAQDVEFTNRHLEYAITWFALALLTPILLIFWLWYRKNLQKLATDKSAD
jgi:surfeit locus 1 family protein